MPFFGGPSYSFFLSEGLSLPLLSGGFFLSGSSGGLLLLPLLALELVRSRSSRLDVAELLPLFLLCELRELLELLRWFFSPELPVLLVLLLLAPLALLVLEELVGPELCVLLLLLSLLFVLVVPVELLEALELLELLLELLLLLLPELLLEPPLPELLLDLLLLELLLELLLLELLLLELLLLELLLLELLLELLLLLGFKLYPSLGALFRSSFAPDCARSFCCFSSASFFFLVNCASRVLSISNAMLSSSRIAACLALFFSNSPSSNLSLLAFFLSLRVSLSAANPACSFLSIACMLIMVASNFSFSICIALCRVYSLSCALCAK